MMDVALVGCGHMGSHHARVISSHPRSRLVAMVDLVPDRAQRLAAEFGTEARATLPEGIDAVVVATPTATHGRVASPIIAGGAWCLVEKPLAATRAAALSLHSPRLAVGHLERFNPAVRAAGPLVPRVVEARRMAPPSGRSCDIDVVLDLMIHDLDLVLSWATGEVVWLDAVGVAVDGPLIDTASVRLRTTDGLTATLMASRVEKRPERSIRVYERGRFTSLDLHQGRAIRSGTRLAVRDGRDALTAQWDAFVMAVEGERAVAVGTHDAIRAVSLAERIGECIRATSVVTD